MIPEKQVRVGISVVSDPSEARGVLLEVGFSSTLLSPPAARAYAHMLSAAANAVDAREAERLGAYTIIPERP